MKLSFFLPDALKKPLLKASDSDETDDGEEELLNEVLTRRRPGSGGKVHEI